MIKTIPTNYYQQFSADYNLEYPAEGFGGWKEADLPINMEKTAFVVMHVIDVGSMEEVPGYYRCVEYLPRSNHIAGEIYPGFLEKVRKKGIKLFHIPLYEHTALKYPGYKKTLDMAGPEPRPEARVDSDPVLNELREFRSNNCWVGRENLKDKEKGYEIADFYDEVKPLDDEHVAFTSHQLFSLCRHYGLNHLIYTGFAVNACLTMSPCGFIDMSRRGIMCSIIPELTTAVENKESIKGELNKKYGLWSFAIQGGGFVYELSHVEKHLLCGDET